MSHINFWDHNGVLHENMKCPLIFEEFTPDGNAIATAQTKYEHLNEMFFLDFVVVDRPNETNPFFKKALYQKVMSAKGVLFLKSYIKDGVQSTEMDDCHFENEFEKYTFYNAQHLLSYSLNQYGTYDVANHDPIPKSLYLPKIKECLREEGKSWFVANRLCAFNLMTKEYANDFLDAAEKHLVRNPNQLDYCKLMRAEDDPIRFFINNRPSWYYNFDGHSALTYLYILKQKNLGFRDTAPISLQKHLGSFFNEFRSTNSIVDNNVLWVNESFNAAERIEEYFNRC